MNSWLCTCGAHNAKGDSVCEGCGAERPVPPRTVTDTPVPVHEYGDAVGHVECVANAGEKQDVAKQ